MSVITESESHSTLTNALSITDIESDTIEAKGDDTPPKSPQSINILENRVIQ